MGPAFVEIPLSRGLVALVDVDDAASVTERKWYAVPASDGSTFYAARSHPETRRQLRLHNVLMQPPPGLFVDHINRDGLDNRRSNLRLATARQNMANRRFPVGVSGYRGVHRAGRRWLATVSIAGRTIAVGRFDDAREAAMAFDAAAIERFGEFAVLNFPEAIASAEAAS